MITVKKNAIKYKSSDGTMKDSGVLCQVGTFGEDLFQYASSLNGMFGSVVFPENTEIELNLPNIKNLGGTFQNASNIKKIKLKGNVAGNVIRLNSCFWGVSNLETIDLSEFKCTFGDMGGAFRQSPALKYIYGEFDCTNTTTMQSTFLANSALEHLRFKKETISVSLEFEFLKNLTDESIQSIIEGLAVVETAQRIKLHNDVKAKLTEEQIAQITSKNWTLA